MLLAVLFSVVPMPGFGEGCTTQARMTAQQRTAIGTAAYGLASAIQANDGARVKADTISQYANDPNQAYLVRTTSEHLTGDTLAISQAYLLDAAGRKPGDSSEAEFTCALAGTVSETDFNIPGLPPGQFAFVMAEAQGPQPWTLSFLLEQEGGAWKMAGFYPHARTAAGHDGLWYWTAARTAVKQNKPWLAWVDYRESDSLLRPTGFVTSGNIDKLQAEQHAAAPEMLTNGVSMQVPLSIEGAGGTVYKITDLAPRASDDTKQLNLFLRIEGASSASVAAATEYDVAAARALLTAHPELVAGFTDVIVQADLSGSMPVTVQRPMGDVVTVKH